MVSNAEGAGPTVVEVTADRRERDVEMDNGFKASTDMNDDCMMPPVASLFLMYCGSALALINLVIILPTGRQYASGMGANDAEYGLAVGMIPLAALLGIVLNQWMLKGLLIPLKQTMLILIVGSVGANLLYALDGLVQSKNLFFCSRLLTGIFNGFNLPLMYISLAVGTQRRAEVSLYSSAANTLGLAIGPALAAGLNFMMLNVFTSHNALWNASTAPGYCMALLYMCYMAMVSVLFQDLPVEVTAPPMPTRKKVQAGPFNGLPLLVTFASVWYLCVVGMAMAGSEVYIVAMLQLHMRLSVTDSGLMAALLYFASGIATLIMGRYVAPFLKSDRTGLFLSSLLACMGCVPPYILSVVHAQSLSLVACACVTWMLTFAGIIRAFALSLSSKLVAPHAKSLMVTVGMVGQTIGRGIGPIYGAVVDDASFALLTGGMLGATMLMSMITYKCMRHEVSPLHS